MQGYYYIVDVTNNRIPHSYQSGSGSLPRLYDSLESARKVAIIFAKGGQLEPNPYPTSRSRHLRVLKLEGNVPILEIIAKKNSKSLWGWDSNLDEVFVTEFESPRIEQEANAVPIDGATDRKWWSLRRPKTKV